MVHFGALPGSPLYDAEARPRRACRGRRARISRRCRRPASTRSCSATRTTGPTSSRSTRPRPRPWPMSSASCAPKSCVPFGVNVLWDPMASVALAAATGASFVREIFTGTYASDMGPWTPDAGAAMRYRDRLGRARPRAALQHLGRVRLFARPAQPAPTGPAVRCSPSIPDAILVSGTITGEAAAMSRPRSGEEGAADDARCSPIPASSTRPWPMCSKVADGCIVGSSLEGRRQHLERRRSRARRASSCGSPAPRGRAEHGARAGLRRGAKARIARLALRADAHPGPQRPRGSGARLHREANSIQTRHLATRDRPARQSDRDARRRRRCAERHAVRPHGPARPHRAQDRGERLDPGRAPRRRAGEGAARAGGAALRCAAAATVPGVIANKSHHATPPEEKYRVCPIRTSMSIAASRSAEEARAAGIDIGTPVVYAPTRDRTCRRPHRRHLGRRPRRLRRASSKWRARLKQGRDRPTVHLVFSVQEEFNLRGAVTAAQALSPTSRSSSTSCSRPTRPTWPRAATCALGGGPAMSLYSFHGRGTLNGTIPHPALVRAVRGGGGAREDLPLQRSAHTGALTDSSYVQLVGEGRGVRSIWAFPAATPIRRSKCAISPISRPGPPRCSPAIGRIGRGFSLDRDDRREPLSRHRYRHFRIEGRARRRTGRIVAIAPRAHTG